MIEQTGNALVFYVFYTTAGVGATGLTVTADIYRNRVSVSTAQACSEMGGGVYYYTLSSATNNAEGEYIVIFKTTSTVVDQQWIPALWVTGKAGVEYLDASIDALPTNTELNTALASADDAVLAAIALLPTTDDINDINLSATELSDIATSVWSSQTTGLTTLGSIGKLLVTNIDAKISSVCTLGAGSVSWTVTINEGATPIDGVDVWITTDSAGTNMVARGSTNTSGQVVFMLDVGTYYCWKQLAGYTFTNPETITVI